MMEQENKNRSRVKVAFFWVVGIHVAVIMVALLAQGCKREQPTPPTDIVDTTMETDTNLFPTDASLPPYSEPIPEAPVDMPPAVVVPATPAVTEYVIQKGDTFYGIAKQYGVSMKAIQNANPTVEPTKLKPGQKIVIPPVTSTPAGAGVTAITESGEQIHVVKSGDTLSSIAARYHTTVKEIRAANNLTTDKIYVGDKLKIPVKVEAPATPPPITEPYPAPMTVPPATDLPPPAR